MTDRIDIPQGSVASEPSVTDVLSDYRELDLPASSVGMKPLSAEALKVLRRVEGYADPGHLASLLTSGLHTLWIARKCGELADEDADATLWMLSEMASLLEHAIEANRAATWWLAQHEKVAGNAVRGAKAKGRGRRKPGDATK